MMQAVTSREVQPNLRVDALTRSRWGAAHVRYGGSAMRSLEHGRSRRTLRPKARLLVRFVNHGVWPVTITADDVSRIYSMRMLLRFSNLHAKLFYRTIESVAIDVGSCTRSITVDWKLPTSEEALPTANPADRTTIATHAASLEQVALPLILTRKGQLLHDLKVVNEDATPVTMCSNAESKEQLLLVLKFLWTSYEDRLTVLVGAGWVTVNRTVLTAIGNDYVSAARLSWADGSRDLVDAIDRLKVLTSGAGSAAPVDQLLEVARYFMRRHVTWVRVAAQPGRAIRLHYQFTTRFAAEYDPSDGAKLTLKAIGKLRRFVGQYPSNITVPISRAGQSESYHFQTTVPAECYVVRQGIVLESNLGDNSKIQESAIRAYSSSEGARLAGADEAGGSFAHLYTWKLPVKVRNQVFARVSFAERPPGTAALVLWMLLFAVFASGLYWLLWEQVTKSDSRGVDIAALFIGLPALAVVWFARAFREEVRPRVSLVSRLGIVVTALTTMYALLSIFINRSICVGVDVDNRPLPPCPPALTSFASRDGLLIAGGLLVAAALLVGAYRIWSHVRYRQQQRRILGRYRR
jgi:hypothetical protein